MAQAFVTGGSGFIGQVLVRALRGAGARVCALDVKPLASSDDGLLFQNTDIGDYAALNDWWRRQFPDVEVAPARFTFQAGALPFGCKIEVQAVAAHGR